MVVHVLCYTPYHCACRDRLYIVIVGAQIRRALSQVGHIDYTHVLETCRHACALLHTTRLSPQQLAQCCRWEQPHNHCCKQAADGFACVAACLQDMQDLAVEARLKLLPLNPAQTVATPTQRRVAISQMCCSVPDQPSNTFSTGRRSSSCAHTPKMKKPQRSTLAVGRSPATVTSSRCRNALGNGCAVQPSATSLPRVAVQQEAAWLLYTLSSNQPVMT